MPTLKTKSANFLIKSYTYRYLNGSGSLLVPGLVLLLTLLTSSFVRIEHSCLKVDSRSMKMIRNHQDILKRRLKEMSSSEIERRSSSYTQKFPRILTPSNEDSEIHEFRRKKVRNHELESIKRYVTKFNLILNSIKVICLDILGSISGSPQPLLLEEPGGLLSGTVGRHEELNHDVGRFDLSLIMLVVSAYYPGTDLCQGLIQNQDVGVTGSQRPHKLSRMSSYTRVMEMETNVITMKLMLYHGTSMLFISSKLTACQ